MRRQSKLHVDDEKLEQGPPEEIARSCVLHKKLLGHGIISPSVWPTKYLISWSARNCMSQGTEPSYWKYFMLDHSPMTLLTTEHHSPSNSCAGPAGKELTVYPWGIIFSRSVQGVLQVFVIVTASAYRIRLPQDFLMLLVKSPSSVASLQRSVQSTNRIESSVDHAHDYVNGN